MAKSLEHIQCVFITREYFDQVVQWSRKYFLNDEPLCHSINLKESTGHDYYIRHSISQEVSVMAIDTSQGNRIVGLRGHRVAKRGEPSTYNPPKDEKWELLMDLGGFAANRVDVWNRYNVDTMIECKFLAVHPEYRGLGISYKMMEFTFEWMRKEKISLIYCWATSLFTKKVMENLGFKKVDEMDYVYYKVDGVQVFSPEKIHKGYAIYIKMVE